MLRSVKAIEGFKLAALDGDIGKCADFLFDDERWTIRYMVADTGDWLAEHKVLISPISFDSPDWASNSFPVKLSTRKIEDAPRLEDDAPVSRRYEMRWNKYYGWPAYWTGPGLWVDDMAPGAIQQLDESVEEKEFDPEAVHIRSCDELMKTYKINAKDGHIGHVQDFILDDVSWAIRYLVVNTRDWLPGGREVLVSPVMLGDVSWAKNEVDVDLTREQVRDSPEYDSDEPINREYEKMLFDYYGRPVYWEKE